MVAAAGCAALGGRTSLIECDRLGGECTWTGCVPSKALLHIAGQAALARKMPNLGIHLDEPRVDFATVMHSVRETRRAIYEHSESPAYLRQLGVRPLKASARFLDSRTLEVERDGRSRTIGFRSAIVATGSRPAIPDIAGLSDVPYLTTDSLFELNQLPARLAIIGCGAVGVEMAQAFARLGSKVTAITSDEQLLPGSDRWAASTLAEILHAESVEFHFSRTVESVAAVSGGIELKLAGFEHPDTLTVDALLVATGRKPNTEALGLAAAGVEFDASGIAVDDWCRTSARHIFASGDVTTAPKFTHIADNMSRAAALNAMTRLPLRKYEQRLVPRITYTDPELATIGETVASLESSGGRYESIDVPFEKVDRARIEGSALGSIRIYHRRGKLLGATIIGPQAGEMIDYFALAMRNGLRLNDIADTVVGYPTMLLGAKRAADQFLIRLPQRWMVQGFRLAFGYRGGIPAYIGTDQVI